MAIRRSGSIALQLCTLATATLLAPNALAFKSEKVAAVLVFLKLRAKSSRGGYWRRAGLGAVASFALLVCGGCRHRPLYVWNCDEGPKGCSCFGRKVDDEKVPPEKLCVKKFECCVFDSDLLRGSSAIPTCKCWNPTQGGPTCESSLPENGGNFISRRVDRCVEY